MKITLKNFRCYEDKTFDFGDNGLTLLSGGSGTGKTSLMMAIDFSSTITDSPWLTAITWLKEIFDLVCKYLNLPEMDVPVVPPASDDVPVVALDPSTTTEKFGWKARVAFEETILNQLAWYDKHGVTDVFSHLKSAS